MNGIALVQRLKAEYPQMDVSLETINEFSVVVITHDDMDLTDPIEHEHHYGNYGYPSLTEGFAITISSHNMGYNNWLCD